MSEEGGVWRTVSGRRIFIRDGQNLSDAMRESGKFGQSEKIEDFGEAYTEFSGRPEEAIEKLLDVKGGYVPAAIYKDDIGDIDFIWGKGGKDGFGLAHIIERRGQSGIDGEEFVRQIPKLLKNGEVMRGKFKDRVYVSDKKETAVVRLDYDGKKATWLVTAYIKE
ncbi:MAG TPA: hypothetical protein VN673_01165 [Clostridia bacterium]|nr:hypothetical protein [Clostridia bacterium]